MLLFALLRPQATANAEVASLDLVDGARRTLLSVPNGYIDHPAWLPDGSGFVFAWITSSGRSSTARVARHRAEQSRAAMSILPGASAATGISTLTSSPDGRLAFDTSGGIAVADLVSPEVEIVTDGHNPGWHPDGRALVFLRTDGSGNDALAVLELEGHHAPRAIEETVGAPTCPAFSPSGEEILFVTTHKVSERTSASELWRVPLAGGPPARVATSNVALGCPLWAPDGSIYVTTVGREKDVEHRDLWRVRPRLSATDTSQ
jgi:Tol biopolymer transport system component